MQVRAWLIGATVAGLALWGWSCHERQVGELRGRIASLQQSKQRVDTVYKTQTKTLTIVRVKTDSILRTDTLFRVDTVRQIVARERLACDAVIRTCEQRVAVRDSIIKALEGRSNTAGHLAFLLGGLVAGYLIK